MVLDGASKSKARGGQIRFRASHPFCSCGFFARMMPPQRLFLPHVLTSPYLQTNMRVAVCIQNSRCTVPTESTVGRNSHLIYRRPENDLSVTTTVSANLGGQVSMRDVLHSTPFSPRNQSPSSSHSAPCYCVKDHHGSENLSRKNLEQGRHFGPLPPNFGQKLHSLHTHNVTKEVHKNLRLTPQDQQHLCSGSAPSDAVPDAHRCATRVPPTGSQSRSCVHSFDAYLCRVEVSFRRLTSLHTLTEHRIIHRCCSFRH